MADHSDRLDEFCYHNVTLSANGAASLDLSGTYLYEAEVYASADSEISLVFKTAAGRTICTKTDIDATGRLGITLVDDATELFAACVGRPTVTLSKLCSGTVNIIAVGSRSPQ